MRRTLAPNLLDFSERECRVRILYEYELTIVRPSFCIHVTKSSFWYMNLRLENVAAQISWVGVFFEAEFIGGIFNLI